MTLEEFLSSLDNRKIKIIEDNFAKIAPILIENLIKTILTEPFIEIGIFTEGNKVWAGISNDPLGDDKILTLRMNKENILDLQMDYYNDEKGKYSKVTHVLTKSEINIVPDGLITIFKNTLVLNKPQAIDIHLLNKNV